jgi:hypothetical protein
MKIDRKIYEEDRIMRFTSIIKQQKEELKELKAYKEKTIENFKKLNDLLKEIVQNET